MSENVNRIIEVFEKNANPEDAFHMKKYMKEKFEYFGIKSPLRKELSKEFLKKDRLPSKEEYQDIVKELWEKDERELQYLAIDIAKKYKTKLDSDDHQFIEFMVVNKSWWDTVDLTAAHIAGSYFQLYPDMIDQVTKEWMDSGNFWLQRTCILYQLSYKDDLDTDRLVSFIEQVKHKKEFFIQKAIGWSLREYSKRNPEWVREYVAQSALVGLSKREAIRLID